MPLVPAQGPAYDLLSAVGFCMLEGDHMVHVEVTYEALEAVGDVPPCEVNYVARCEKNRDMLEQIASRKYETGDIVAIDAIKITSQDLIGPHPGWRDLLWKH